MDLCFLNFCSLSKQRCAVAFCTITFFFLTSFVAIRAQEPTITLFSPATVCQGDAITITGTNFTGATSVKLGTLDATNFVVNNATSITATVASLSTSGPVVVTTPDGTATSASTLTILQAPIPALTHANAMDAPFTNCNGNNVTYQLTVSNSSSNTTGSNEYKIEWGDNTPAFLQSNWPAGAQTSHTYASQGYFTITFTITPTNGCTRTVTYSFYNGTNPLASITTTNPTTGLCVSADVEFQIGNWFNNSPGTTYQLNFGDGTTPVTLTHPLNSTNTTRLYSHTYTTSSCPSPDFTAILKASNGCFTTTYTLNQIIIRKKPTANFTTPSASACINGAICFTNTTINGYSGNSCNTATTYLWDFGDGTTSTSANPSCHTYSSAGTYAVTLTASNTSCGNDTKTKTVIVLPASPLPVVSANPISYCQGQPAVPLTATGTGLLWYTTASGGTGNSTAPTPPTSTAQTLTYYVSQTLSGNCESPRAQVSVVVNATPGRPGVVTPVQLCLNQAATPLTATGTNLSWYTAPTGGTGSATSPTPSTASVGTATYYVSQTLNGCEGPRASIVVTVNALATAPGVTTPVNYCQNQTATSLTASGTSLLWYTTPTGGTGSSTAPTPSTATAGTTTYYVSQVTGCGEGPRSAIVINVNAGPSASISYPNTSLCNFIGTPSTPNPPVAVTMTGTPGGVYSIVPSTGLPINATTGTISPSGALPGTYTIKYAISGGGCPDFTTTTTVTISGSPSATLTYPSAACTSTPIVNAQFNGSQGGTFTSSTGLTINSATGAITPVTSTPGTYTVTYTILPNAPCPGFSITANITITQAPSATIAYNLANVCNVVNTPSTPNPPISVTQTGTQGGSYSIVPATGLSIDAATGTITPSGATAGSYTIKYTIPGANGCPDFITTATVTVSGAPTASIAYPSALCTSSNATSVQLAGTQGGSFTSSTGLNINASTGLITPATSTPGTYTITYTILPSPPCPGFTTTTTITITQAPSAVITYGATNLCNIINTPATPNLPVPVSLTGTQGGNYRISPATGLPINAATGTIDPSGATPGTYTISYILAASGGCPVVTATTTVTVSAAPFATIAYTRSPYCKGISIPQPVSLSGTAGGTFSAGSGLSINPVTGAINPSLSTPGIYSVIYTVAPSSPCPGYSATASVEIVASPVLSFPVTTQSICSGGTAVYVPTSTISNTTYTWSVVGQLPANVAGIISGTASGPNPSISLSFTNVGSLSQPITVQVIPVNPAQNPCAGAPFNLTLNVNPIPVAPAAPDTVHFCMGTPAVPLTVNALLGNTVKWYDQNLVLLNAPPMVSTATPSQFIFYVSQSNAYGCESPKAKVVAVVHPTPKIISSSYTHPTSCGLPSGSITLNVLDLNDNPIPNLAVVVHYNRFLTAYSIATSTNVNGKITIALSAGTYSGLYVEVHGCTSQTLPDVFVLKDPNPPALPVAGYNPPICSETVLNLTAVSPTSSQSGIIQYVWAGPAFSPAGDTVTNSTVTFPSASISDAGTYVVYAVQNNCISLAASFQVVIKQSPSKPVISANTPLCVGSTLTLQAHSSISVSDPTLNYVWRGPGAGFSVNSPNAGINNVTIQDAGTYSITATSPLTGCSTVSDTLIQIGNYPTIKFPADTVVLPTGSILALSPLITNAGTPNVLPMKKYEWSPLQELACSDPICSSAKATIKNNICYTVKATNIYGCSGSTTICVQVFCKGSQIFVPNTFLPRGDLPENTRLMVRGSGIMTVKSFRIFNRWGKVVFERNNFPPNVADFGWDGRVNGKMADQGVYVYTVEVLCENGTPYFIKGNVTLL